MRDVYRAALLELSETILETVNLNATVKIDKNFVNLLV